MSHIISVALLEHYKKNEPHMYKAIDALIKEGKIEVKCTAGKQDEHR